MLFLLIAVLTTLGLLAALQRWGPARFEFRHSTDRSRVHCGEVIEYRQVFTNRKILPLPWVGVETEFTKGLGFLRGAVNPYYMAGRELLAGPVATLWYEKVTRIYPVRCDNRGAFTFGPTRLSFGDIIGLQETRVRTVDTPARVIVYPRVLALQTRDNYALDLSGRRTRPNFVFQDPFSYAGTRDYVPCDSPRLVNWKASARTGQLQANVFHAVTAPRVVVLINVITSEYAWRVENLAALELAVITAASVINRAVTAGCEVSLGGNYRTMTEAMDTELTTLLPFGQGLEHQELLLESLARLHPYVTATYESVIRQGIARMNRDSRLVLITPYFDPQLAGVLEQVRREGISPLLLLVGDRYLDTPGIPGIEVFRVGEEAKWRELDALRLV